MGISTYILLVRPPFAYLKLKDKPHLTKKKVPK